MKKKFYDENCHLKNSWYVNSARTVIPPELKCFSKSVFSESSLYSPKSYFILVLISYCLYVCAYVFSLTHTHTLDWSQPSRDWFQPSRAWSQPSRDWSQPYVAHGRSPTSLSGSLGFLSCQRTERSWVWCEPIYKTLSFPFKENCLPIFLFNHHSSSISSKKNGWFEYERCWNKIYQFRLLLKRIRSNIDHSLKGNEINMHAIVSCWRASWGFKPGS